MHHWPYLAYPWLYFLSFALANPLIFRWYLTPPLPPYMLAILIGADRLLQVVFFGDVPVAPSNSEKGNSKIKSSVYTIAATILIILAPVLTTSRGWVFHSDQGINRPAPAMAWYQLELLYRQAADYLAPEMDAHPEIPLLAAGDVGVLDYYTPARILDTVGLNSPQSTQYYPLEAQYYEINYAIPPDLILDFQSDYVIILEVYGRKGLLIDPRFQSDYYLRKKIPTDIYGSDGMLIFQRK